MATTNGLTTLSSDSVDHELHSGTKRKRQASRDSNAPASPKITSTLGVTQSSITDVYQVISSHDAAPAILNFSIDAVEDETQQHPAKRTKTTEDSGPTTVSRKVTDSVYASLDELQDDIHKICAAQLASLREPDDEEDSKQIKRLSGDDVAQMQDIMSFEVFAHDIISREKALFQPRSSSVVAKPNGIKEEADPASLKNVPEAGKTVLSLYGNAPTARQLFSSFQEEAGTDIALQELGLPTMLVATKVLPTSTDDAQARQRRTIGDLFAPPASLPTLQPPPKSKSSSNRSTSIAFHSADRFAPKTSRKGTYTVQPVTSGKWLRYGTQPRRRSSRSKDRASLDRSQQGEIPEDDLFTSVYSSFAPTRDNSQAIIPTDTCDLLWWQKFGRRRAQDLFESSDEQQDMDVDEPDAAELRSLESEHEGKVLQELVNTFDEEEVLEYLTEEVKRPEDMEAEALLVEITELTRTLASHQWIRHSVLPPSSSRTPSSPAPLRSSMIGTPSEPSADEKSVYRHLQAHLASLIARLPPYLVAKLDGVQVEDLAVNRTFLVEGKTTRGVMEEDQATRAQRGAAAAAASAASKTSTQQYGQYGRWPGTNNNARPALTPQTSQRSSLSAYGRSSSGLATATPSQPSRPTYAQMGSYTAPVINRTPLQPNYGQAGTAGQQYYGRPNYGQPGLAQGSPQPRPGQYPPGMQQQFQQQQQRFAATPNYSQYAPKPATPSFAAPTPNGRATPSAPPPPPPTYAGSPVKLAAQVAPQQQQYGQT